MSSTEVGNGGERDETRGDSNFAWVGDELGILSNLGAEGDDGEGRFCKAGIGAARYFNPERGSANLFCRRPFGGGGWVLCVRPTHATTPIGLCFGALRHLPLCP